jgi:hypothetical protein
MKIRLTAILVCGLISGRGLAQDTDFTAMNAAIDAQIVSMKKQTPIEIDAVTKMTDMTRMGLGITYYYETKYPESMWTQAMREAAFQRALKANCSTKETRTLLDYGYSLRHVFFDGQGKLVSNALITRDMCASQ